MHGNRNTLKVLQMVQPGKELARKTIEVFDRAGVDLIVVNSAGCGSVMKEYWELLRSDPDYAERAEAFSKKVRDVSQVLAEVPFAGRLKELNLTVTYHDACHLAHGQRVRQEPRKILKAIPGLQLIELKESDFCCGSAGVYNILQPALAEDILDKKIKNIENTDAECVVAGNPGCLLQIQKGFREKNQKLSIAHPIEILDKALK